MPRESSIAESAKQRSLRVPLDYYKRQDNITRGKLILSAALAGVTLAYVAWLFVPVQSARRQLSPGPVAAAHATWNDDCQQCHDNFRPLRSDAVDFRALFASTTVRRKTVDAKCIVCHQVERHPHHAKASDDDVPSCAACHRDHRGSSADIVRPSDAMCVSCHRDLKEHHQDKDLAGWKQPFENVTSFVPSRGKHPDFRSLKEGDPGNIKFNHWLHLQPGIAPAEAQDKFTLDRIPEAQKPQYPKTSDAGLIQLDCTACHQPAEKNGRSMQPITYKQHCSACHPLAVKIDGDAAEVPHGLKAGPLGEVLDGLLFDIERDKKTAAQSAEEKRSDAPLIPGRTLGDNLAQRIRQAASGRRAAFVSALIAKCAECHTADSAADREAGTFPELLESSIPPTWFAHARFDHNAHRHKDCSTCHKDAYEYKEAGRPQFISPPPDWTRNYSEALDHERVMIASKESCTECHAPAKSRFDCAECHTYHGREHPPSQSSSIPEKSAAAGLARELHRLAAGHGRGKLDHLTAVSSRPIQSAAATTPVAFFQELETKPGFIGVSTCASAGCHGDASPVAAAWKSALATWVDRDPHAQAYDVLWTARGREMTHLLEVAKSGTSACLTEDQAHFHAIKEFCIGCHATPLSAGSTATRDSYAPGVHCESCHGSAGTWLRAHYLADFKAKEKRSAASGFIDTKEMNQRADACMKCHVGPNDQSGTRQLVDHDLIAAGHPRLSFEFHAYHESLPEHWNRKTDESRQPAGEYHYRSWLAGQWQHTASSTLLNTFFHSREQREFSQYNCLTCHHQFAAHSWRQRSSGNVLKPLPPWLPIPLPNVAGTELAAAERLAFARDLLKSVSENPQWETELSWESGLQSYLAIKAIAADVSTNSHPQAATEIATLEAALARLGGYLGADCFQSLIPPGRQPTTYDTPTEFEPTALKNAMQPVAEALESLHTTVQQPPKP